MSAWPDLIRELDAWALAGQTATFWWRDDDATAETGALDRLLDLANRHRAALALSVIPYRIVSSLAGRLAVEPRITVVQHGYAHVNHAPPGEKKAELGAHRPLGVALGELTRGALALDEAFGQGWLRVMVPPHNRIADALAASLPDAGYLGLSTYGRKQRGAAGLVWVDVQVDPIDWQGTRGFVGAANALAAAIRDLAWRRAREFDPAPTGLLTHHLVHDSSIWSFLDDLLATLAGHPAARIVHPRAVFAAQ